MVVCLGLACGCITSQNAAPGSGQSEIPVVDSPEEFSCERLEFEKELAVEYDWSQYAAEMLAKIRENWQIPMLARQGVRGSVKLRFVIKPGGYLACMDFLKKSKYPPFDTSAWNAVAASQPFLQLPPDAEVVHGELVSLTFHYNQRPSEGNGGLIFEGGVVSMSTATNEALIGGARTNLWAPMPQPFFLLLSEILAVRRQNVGNCRGF